MTVFGVALLAICTLVGVFIGDLLGVVLGVKANVGGVGLAMMMLMAARVWLVRRGGLSHGVKLGVEFWATMYIPIVVAMAAQQNVVAAARGGPIVLIAGLGSRFGLLRLRGPDQPPRAGAANFRPKKSPRSSAAATSSGATRRPISPAPHRAASRPWPTDPSHPLNRPDSMLHMIEHVFIEQSLVAAFAVVGAVMWLSLVLSRRLTAGRVHGSAIAIVIGLGLAYVGGLVTGGQKGLADIPVFAGIGLMGGAMLRDFAIVATAFEVDVIEARRAGLLGVVSLGLGTILPFLVGGGVALAFGYTDAVSITTIGAGAITYIVGPVTGAALGADSAVMALAIATGVFKAVLMMIGTPLVARFVGLDNPRSAMAYGGLMGTVSGVAGGLAATDPKLVPYGALTATFHTGIGCLVGPSVLYLAVRALVG